MHPCPCPWQERLAAAQQEMVASVGDRIEVLFNTGTSKGYDLYAGQIVSHSFGKVHTDRSHSTLTPPAHNR